MKVSIISKNYGNEVIDTDNYNPMMASNESTLFKIVEHMFNEWYDHNTQSGAPMARDIEGMYYGEGDQPAIYTKHGAIIQGIENVVEEIKEKQKNIITTKDIQLMDVEAAFE